MPARVTVVEVGPRDGLQNEAATVTTADKVAFIDLLSDAGLPVIEAGAFVSPKWVPQMADADAVFAQIERRPSVRYPGLVPNLAASESFSSRNINQSIAASLDTYRVVCARAAELGIRVRGYLSTAFGCPFEGAVPPSRVAEVAAALVGMGAFEVAVSDTIGIAHPGQVGPVVAAVSQRVPQDRIALHFHDTRGTALANVLAALEVGVATFDASCGGLGGCPYAPGATGNLATEDLVYMLNGLGIETGVSLDAVVAASRFIESRVGHALPSRYYQAATRARRSS
jgi:hydroxymethylglutaryl-CoA lyase